MGTHPIFESDFDCLTEIGYRVMTRNLRSKRTAESRTTKSPEPKRQSTGPTDLIQQTRTARPKTAPATSRNEELEQKTLEKREAQRKKFAAYKEKKKAQEEERKKKLAERPAWRPAGAAVTRSMTRGRKTASSSAILVPSSSSSSLKSVKEEKSQRTGKKLSLPIPKNKDQNRKSEESGMEIEGESSKSENVEKLEKSPEILTEDRNFSTPARGVKSGPLPSTGITPIAQRLQISPRPEIPPEPVTEPPSDEIEIDLEAQETSINEEILGKLNLPYWKQLFEEYERKLLTAKWDFAQFPKTDDEFWEVEKDRAVGEVGFFLEQKSKFVQFKKMLDDPLGEKFKVKTNEDIQSFWEGMVLPSVQDFLTRSAWLIRAGENKWPENMKAQKPSQKIGSSPVKAKPKENRPKVPSDPEAAAKAEAKKLKVKKDAEERRKKMREMMAAKKRAISASALQETSTNFL